MNRYFNVLEYIKNLTLELNCQIAIKDFVGFIEKDPDVAQLLNPYYIHKSSFCMFIKLNREMWKRCQDTSKLLHKKCETSDGYFVGTCYCGCSEMVIPVKYNGKVIAAIGIYGFELNDKRAVHRIAKAEKKYGIDKDRALRLYAKSVKDGNLDVNKILMRCGILVDFFRMYYKALIIAGTVSPHTVYSTDTNRAYILSNTIEFIRLNYTNDIRMADIAAFCQCSESYISHIFKKSMNQNINQFINQVRIDKAKQLIAETSCSFLEISGRCGFSDPNYFSSVFKMHTGLSPSMYKKNIKTEKVQI
ncbi:helix-turn-helix domain-containing protein [Ruminiclostridium papyrosolvens]|uniref:HTH araC/xylS-type domain-containing protein n=1 Tax=Ruminiclostridium papyrosolvens C7 TaxID=1330534 RepID=U4R053_9FIRM|nr:helix-turn-helix domain-containing protein [Ruminiclostridium papyrosolvens]EPR10501.1 hypothetical protein L323_12940 [Ruminiclostridium papyrosolvens C7]